MKKNNEIKRLEKISGCYNSEGLDGVNERYHLQVRDSLIPKDGCVSALELGCGKGLWSKVLCSRYDIVDIVDGSGELLEKVRSENSGCRAEVSIHKELVEDFIYSAQRKWQHIYMTFLLEHVIDPVALLAEVKKLLEENGCLFAAVPNAESLHRIIAYRMGIIECVGQLSDNDVLVGHRRIYSIDILRSQLLEAGYTISEERTVGLKPLSLGQMKEWPCELVEAFCESADLSPQHGAYITIKAEC